MPFFHSDTILFHYNEPLPVNLRVYPRIAALIRHYGAVQGLECFKRTEEYLEVQCTSPISWAKTRFSHAQNQRDKSRAFGRFRGITLQEVENGYISMQEVIDEEDLKTLFSPRF
jgi:hypothetical protein